MDLKKHRIKISDVNRPALRLSGFFEHFEQSRTDHQTLSTPIYRDWMWEKKEKILRNLPHVISMHYLLGIYSRMKIFYRLLRKMMLGFWIQEKHIGIYGRIDFSVWSEQLAPCISIHGVLVDVYGEGLLIMGESGIGKSEAALELVRRGHRLVTDDVVRSPRLMSIR